MSLTVIKSGKLKTDTEITADLCIIGSSNQITALNDFSTVKHLVIKSNCVIESMELPAHLETLSLGPGVVLQSTVVIPDSVLTLSVTDLSNWRYLNVPNDLGGLKEVCLRKSDALELCHKLLSEVTESNNENTELLEKISRVNQTLRFVSR